MSLDIQITDEDLPVLSVVATQALDLVDRDDVTNAQIEELVKQDPALTQRLLHVANSPFYCGRVASQSISSAAMRLGLRQLRTVLTMAATGELFDFSDPYVKALWEQAVGTALASHTLVEALHLAGADEAFIAGMLHNVGALVIYSQYPAEYARTLEQARETGRPLHVVEAEHYQFFTHMSIGGLVCRKWGLGEGVIECARWYEVAREAVPEQVTNERLVCVVSLAQALIGQLGIGYASAVVEDLTQLACYQTLDPAVDAMEKARQRIADTVAEQISSMMG